MTATLSYSDHSVLSTPDLSSPSSASSSNDSSSFYSALSSDDWNSIHAGAPPTNTSSPSSNSFDHTSPFLVNFPSKPKSASAAVLSSVKNIASSVNETMFGTSFGEPRKPERRKPAPLPLIDPFDELFALSQGGPSMVSTASTDVLGISRGRTTSLRPARNFPRGREMSHVPGVRMRVQRMNSLPSIPSATLFTEPLPELTGSKSENVQFDTFNRTQEFETRKQEEHTPYQARLGHRNANAMASLAWTGTLPSALPSSFPISNTGLSSSAHPMSWTLTSACRSTWSLSDSADLDSALLSASIPCFDELLPLPHPELLVHPNGFSVPETDMRRHRRRWTLAMVITDDQITDEKLVDKLERMIVGNTGGHVSSGWQENTGLQSPLSPVLLSAAIPSSNVCMSPREDPEMDFEMCSVNEDRSDDENRKVTMNTVSSPFSNNQSAIWITARRTLLICREFVRTERSYLSYLQMMLSQKTMTPPPALLLAYLPALVMVSERLLTRMEINPSAVGVAEAFLLCRDQLESAFIGWCGVVGGFFAGEYDGPTVKLARTSSASFGRKDPPKEGSSDSTMKRRVGSWGKRIRSIRSRSWSMTRRDDNASAQRSEVRVGSKMKVAGRAVTQTHSVRELAILPTQRVTRYTLLFRDLVSLTPSSFSQEKVQMALEVAVLLAQRCDKAQVNLAFLHGVY